MRPRILNAIIVCMIFIAMPVSAAIWTVDNTGLSDLFFTTLQAAHNSEGVEDGDTIYVNGSPDSYGNLTATKRLYWIGTGYFLAQNPNTQARPVSSIATSVSFNSGSEGSVLTGFIFTTLYINADDIMILRNWGQSGGDVIYLTHNQEVSNTIIAENYLVCTSGSGIGTHNSILIRANHSHVTIENNIIITTNNGSGIKVEAGAGPITIAHNVISVYDDRFALNIRNAVLHSNILDGRIVINNVESYNNLTEGGELGEADGNVPDVNMAEVFVGEGSSDGRWQLVEDSPAIGAGFEETDCGAFGGLTPYVLSGIPPIPSITLFVAPHSSSGAQGLPIRMNIQSRH